MARGTATRRPATRRRFCRGCRWPALSRTEFRVSQTGMGWPKGVTPRFVSRAKSLLAEAAMLAANPGCLAVRALLAARGSGDAESASRHAATLCAAFDRRPARFVGGVAFA